MNETVYRLQKAGMSERTQLGTLAHSCWWEHYPDVISEEQIRYMLEMNYSPESIEKQMLDGHNFWFVCSEDEPVGFVDIGAQEPESYFIHKFYLLKKCQGKGLGRWVFEAIQNQYPDAKTIRLNVNRQNFKSINFYFKLGFKIEKCVDIPIGRGFVMDDFKMVWQADTKP
ncbi:MAG: GNAT family N-acetyltransferase [Saprospiraceae bacterium]